MIKTIAKPVSWISLVVLIVPSILYLSGHIKELDMVKWIMLLATIVWFVSAGTWMWNGDSK